MAIVPVTKLDMKNKVMFKKIDDDNDIISANCDVIIIFPIHGQFGAVRKPGSGRMIWKTYIFINSSLLS